MDDVLLLILMFAAGAFVGYKLNEFLMVHVFRKMLEDAGITDAQLNQFADHWRAELGTEEHLTNVEVRIEQVNDQLYAFRVENDEFIAQGKTKEDLLTAIEQRMTNVKLIITAEHGAELVK